MIGLAREWTLGINLPTEDAIEYDLEKLKLMDVAGLLIQLISLQHLNRPRREHNLRAQAFARKVVSATAKFVKELEQMGASGLAGQIGNSLSTYASAIKPDVETTEPVAPPNDLGVI